MNRYFWGVQPRRRAASYEKCPMCERNAWTSSMKPAPAGRLYSVQYKRICRTCAEALIWANSISGIPPIEFVGMPRYQRDALGKLRQGWPYFSLTASGKRTFWVVYRGWSELSENEGPLATGYAGSNMEAWEEIKALIGERAINSGPRAANIIVHERHVHKRQARAETRPTTTTTASRREYAYQVDSGYNEYDGGRYAHYIPHRIIRKTARYIFVARAESRQDGTESWRGINAWDVETYRLDRAQLEQQNGTYGPKRYWYSGVWVLDPEAHRREVEARRGQGPSPECLLVLGLTNGATTKDVKRAYRRLSKTLHPDHGGDAEAFIRVQRAYEQAMATAS